MWGDPAGLKGAGWAGRDTQGEPTHSRSQAAPPPPPPPPPKGTEREESAGQAQCGRFRGGACALRLLCGKPTPSPFLRLSWYPVAIATRGGGGRGASGARPVVAGGRVDSPLQAGCTEAVWVGREAGLPTSCCRARGTPPPPPTRAHFLTARGSHRWSPRPREHLPTR